MKINKERYYNKKTKITNERQLIIKDFLDKLNSERKPPFPPLTPNRIAFLLSFMSVSQLKAFYGELKGSNNFSKSFWYRMKASKDYKLMDREKILDDLRKLYISKDYIKFRRMYYRYIFYIDKGERRLIEKTLEDLKIKIQIQEREAKKAILLAQKIIGGKIIK